MKRTVVYFKHAGGSPHMIFAWVLCNGDSIELWKKRKTAKEIYVHHEDVIIPERDTTEEELAALEEELDKHQGKSEDITYGLVTRINELREQVLDRNARQAFTVALAAMQEDMPGEAT